MRKQDKNEVKPYEVAMGKSDYKKLDTRSHFTDFWHDAKSWRENKHIGTRLERRKLNKVSEEFLDRPNEDTQHEVANRVKQRIAEAIANNSYTEEFGYQVCAEEYARWFILHSGKVEFGNK